MAITVTKEMTIGEVMKINTGVAHILMGIGMHCLGCPSSQVESLAEACDVHGKNADEVVAQINAFLSEGV